MENVSLAAAALLLLSIYGVSYFLVFNSPIEEMTFTVFDYLEFNVTKDQPKYWRIFPYGGDTFIIYGNITVEIKRGKTYWMLYKKTLKPRNYIVLEIKVIDNE